MFDWETNKQKFAFTTCSQFVSLHVLNDVGAGFCEQMLVDNERRFKAFTRQYFN
ncbi:hypothetical protein D3C85_1895630 [compost metagenome]